MLFRSIEAPQPLASIAQAYAAGGYRVSWHFPANPRNIFANAVMRDCDLVMLVGEAFGLCCRQVLEQLIRAGIDAPLLCLCDSYSEARAGFAIAAGAADCLPLDDLGRLVAVTRRVAAKERPEDSGISQLSRLHRQTLAARDAERHHLAREFHDAIGHQLIVLQMATNAVMKSLADRTPIPAPHNSPSQASPETPAPTPTPGPTETDHRLRQIEQLAARLAADVRRICHGLYPPMLELMGLGAAIEQLAEPLRNRFDTRVRICPPVEGLRFAAEVEIGVYRIMQEALQNVIKHSAAASVELLLDWQNERLVAMVIDDGRGFDAHAAMTHGLGMITMRERARALDGQLHVSSHPGRTEVGLTAKVTPRQRPMPHGP